jgi:hypothetical protein
VRHRVSVWRSCFLYSLCILYGQSFKLPSLQSTPKKGSKFPPSFIIPYIQPAQYANPFWSLSSSSRALIPYFSPKLLYSIRSIAFLVCFRKFVSNPYYRNEPGVNYSKKGEVFPPCSKAIFDMADRREQIDRKRSTVTVCSRSIIYSYCLKNPF